MTSSDLNESIENSRFPCCFCQRMFSHKRSRDRHLKLHTVETKYRCELCDSAFIRSDHLKSHMKTHDLAKLFQCPSCNATSAALTSHMQAHKSPNQLAKKLKHFVKYQAGLPGVNQQLVTALVKCNANLISSAINTPISTVENVTGQIANNYNFSSQQSLAQFKSTQDNLTNQTNSNKRNLMNLVNQNNVTDFNVTSKRKKLSVDSIETEDTSSSLSDGDDESENNMIFDKNELIVDICGNSLNQTSVDDLNKLSSQNQQVFYCSVCNGEFAHKRSLDRHFRSIHTGDRKFKCDLCDQCYSRSDHLKNHLKSNHKINCLPNVTSLSVETMTADHEKSQSSCPDKTRATKGSTIFNIEKLLSLPSSSSPISTNETKVLSSSLSSSSSSSCSSPNNNFLSEPINRNNNFDISSSALTSFSTSPFIGSPASLTNSKDSLLYQNYFYYYYLNHYHYYQQRNFNDTTSKLFAYPY